MPKSKLKFSLVARWVAWLLGIWLLPYSYVVSMQRMSQNADWHGDRPAGARFAGSSSIALKELEDSYLKNPAETSRRLNLLGTSDPDVNRGEGILLSILSLDSSQNRTGQAAQVCIDLNNLCVLEALAAEGSNRADRRTHFDRARIFMQEALAKSRFIVSPADAACPHLGEILLANENALNLQIRLDY